MQEPLMPSELNELVAALPKDQQRAFKMLRRWPVKNAVNANLAEVEEYLAKLMKAVNGKVPVLTGLHNFTMKSKGFAGRDQVTKVKVYAVVYVECEGETIAYPLLLEKAGKLDNREALKKLTAHPIGFTLCAFLNERGRYAGFAATLADELARFDNAFDKVTNNAIKIGLFMVSFYNELRTVFNLSRTNHGNKTHWSFEVRPQPVKEFDLP